MALNGIGGYGIGAPRVTAEKFTAVKVTDPQSSAAQSSAAQSSAAQSADSLDKFQQIRDLAKKKLDGADHLTRLTDLVKQKQLELNRHVAPPQKMVTPLANFLAQIQASNLGQGVSSAYGKAGGLDKPESKPKLGRFVDFTA